MTSLMALVVTGLRNGTAFMDPETGNPFIVLKYEHIKMGRGGAVIKVKARNILTGAIIERGLKSGGTVEEVDLSKKPVQYLYKDGTTFNFMDPVTFETIELSAEIVGELSNFLLEGTTGTVNFYNETPISFDLPTSMFFTVTSTMPGEKGNTVGNAQKPAIIETGATVYVPMFINEGEKIKVDTRDGKYVERG